MKNFINLLHKKQKLIIYKYYGKQIHVDILIVIIVEKKIVKIV